MAEDHGCTQVGVISELKATLNSQGDADKRIEVNLEKLTEEVRKNQEENQSEFKQINAALITLKDSVTAQQQDIKDLRDDVRNYTNSLNSLYGKVGKMEGTVTDNTVNINRLDIKHEEISKRVDNIEKSILKVTIAAAVIIAIIELFANASNIKQVFFPDKTPVQQVQMNDR